MFILRHRSVLIFPGIPVLAGNPNFPCSKSMLAASPVRSNVSPDNLKPAPVVAITTRPADRLCEHPARRRAEPDPPPATQQHPVREQRDRLPAPIAPQCRGAAVRTKPHRKAVLPCAMHSGQFQGKRGRPGCGGNRAPCHRQRKAKNGDQAQATEHGAGPQHETAQRTVRSEFGGVCGRWHLRSIPMTVLGAATGTRSTQDRQVPKRRGMRPFRHHCHRGNSLRGSRPEAHRVRACRVDTASEAGTARSIPAFREHLLGFSDRPGRVEPLRTRLRAVHDRVAAIQPERVFQVVEPFTGGLIAAIDKPAIGLQQNGGAKIAVTVPPVARTAGRAAGASRR